MVAIICKTRSRLIFFRCNILSESPFPPPLRDRQSPIYQITQESALPLTSSGFPQRICWFKNLNTKKVVLDCIPSVLSTEYYLWRKVHWESAEFLVSKDIISLILSHVSWRFYNGLPLPVLDIYLKFVDG